MSLSRPTPLVSIHAFFRVLFLELMSEMDIDIDTVASKLGEELIEQILSNQPLEVIKAFLDGGSPIWYQNDNEGMSPLHAAAYVQNEELVKLLIEQGAVWNAGTCLPFLCPRESRCSLHQSQLTTYKIQRAI